MCGRAVASASPGTAADTGCLRLQSGSRMSVAAQGAFGIADIAGMGPSALPLPRKPVRHTDLADMLRRWIPQHSDQASQQTLGASDQGQSNGATDAASGALLSKA